MSRNPRGPPPFSSGNRAPPAAPKSKAPPASKDQQRTIPAGVAPRENRADPPRKRPTEAEGREADPKRHREGKEIAGSKDSRLPPPPPNVVANVFAKLGHSTASEADMNAWAGLLAGREQRCYH